MNKVKRIIDQVGSWSNWQEVQGDGWKAEDFDLSGVPRVRLLQEGDEEDGLSVLVFDKNVCLIWRADFSNSVPENIISDTLVSALSLCI